MELQVAMKRIDTEPDFSATWQISLLDRGTSMRGDGQMLPGQLMQRQERALALSIAASNV